MWEFDRKSVDNVYGWVQVSQVIILRDTDASFQETQYYWCSTLPYQDESKFSQPSVRLNIAMTILTRFESFIAFGTVT